MAKLAKHSITITSDYSKPYQEWMAQEGRELAAAVAKVRAANKGDLVGEILRWQRADGYAQYMIVQQNPLTLAHLNIGDAWGVEAALIRGLTLKDARDMVEREHALLAMFSKGA